MTRTERISFLKELPFWGVRETINKAINPDNYRLWVSTKEINNAVGEGAVRDREVVRRCSDLRFRAQILGQMPVPRKALSDFPGGVVPDC